MKGSLFTVLHQLILLQNQKLRGSNLAVSLLIDA